MSASQNRPSSTTASDAGVTKLRPFIDDVDFQLYVGDVRDVLAQLPDESVHCCVTSPPYWGLRDYGTGSWEGGDADCAHRVGGQVQDTKAPGAIASGVRPGVDASSCIDCGAARVDRQLGLEPTPDAYIAQMVAVFAEVRRVLRSDGTCWLNIGDSYCSQPNQRVHHPGGRNDVVGWKQATNNGSLTQGSSYVPGLKPKDLIGIPWMLAFALRADGWWLRSEIVWAKPNPMPESVTDRPTKSHEQVFLLTKSPRYFYDADAIREPAAWERWGDQTNGKHEGSGSAAGWIGAKSKAELRSGRVGRYQERAMYGTGDGTTPRKTLEEAELGRNARSVWEIVTAPYPDAHFATFPPELARRCIAAGCPAGGTVLDPFMGSGTTAHVARKLGRRAVGVELNPDYAALCAKRTEQQSLLAEEVA